MLVVDVETTGTDSRKHSIISIGAVDLKEPSRQFYQECRPWDGAEISDKALECNGFTREQLADPMRMPLELAVKLFLAWADKAGSLTIAGENPRFDLEFIKSSAEIYGLHAPFGYRTFDLHSASITHHILHGRNPPIKDRKSDLDLDATLMYVGLAPEPRPHNALMGAKCEAEAISRLLYGKKLLPEFFKYGVPLHC